MDGGWRTGALNNTDPHRGVGIRKKLWSLEESEGGAAAVKPQCAQGTSSPHGHLARTQPPRAGAAQVAQPHGAGGVRKLGGLVGEGVARGLLRG